MNKCKHHPDYHPASGEPTGTISVNDPEDQVDWLVALCPYCLQVRVKWLHLKLGEAKVKLAMWKARDKPTNHTLLDFCTEELRCEQSLDIQTQRQLVTYTSQRIAELERQLTTEKHYVVDLDKQLDEAEKREAVLREDKDRLDFLDGKLKWASFPFELGEPIRDSIDKARAAVEVK